LFVDSCSFTSALQLTTINEQLSTNMAIRRTRKHTAEVNMSSMTDIIFMLLIFFMLTSTLVSYLPFKLPKSNQRTNVQVKTTVGIDKKGTFTVNNTPVAQNNLEATLRAALNNLPDKKNASITIAAETGVPFVQVEKLMLVANRLKIRTVLATEPHD